MPLEQMNTLFQMLELQMLEFSVTKNTQKERMKKEKLLYKSSLFHWPFYRLQIQSAATFSTKLAAHIVNLLDSSSR